MSAPANYIEIMNWTFENVPFIPGYKASHLSLFLAIVDSVNKNRWNQPVRISVENIFTKAGITKETYLNARKWLCDHQIIELTPGRNANQMALFSLGVAVNNLTSTDTVAVNNLTSTKDAKQPVTLPIIKHINNKPLNKKETNTLGKSASLDLSRPAQLLDNLGKEEFEAKKNVNHGLPAQFLPPTEDQCFNYFSDQLGKKGFHHWLISRQASLFFNNYSSIGWVRRRGQPIEWRFAAKTWIKNNFDDESDNNHKLATVPPIVLNNNLPAATPASLESNCNFCMNIF